MILFNYVLTKTYGQEFVRPVFSVQYNDLEWQPAEGEDGHNDNQHDHHLKCKDRGMDNRYCIDTDRITLRYTEELHIGCLTLSMPPVHICTF